MKNFLSCFQPRFYHLWVLGLLLAVSFSAQAQSKKRQLTGTVTALEDGSTLIGARIVVKNQPVGTMTDAEGNFKLNVGPQAKALVVSYLGMENKTVPLTEANTYRIELVSEAMETDEVVITALGVEREKKALGYSVSEIDGSAITQARENNVVNSLAGKVAGVNITGSQNGPTASANINIRGQSSFSGNNQPLFVVNGLPITNGLNAPGDGLNGSSTIDFGNAASLVNPDDIETISVLKGAAAAALYGTRASNGVVLITTKTGKNAEGFGVEFNSNLSFQNVLRFPDYQNVYGGGGGFGGEGGGKRDWETGDQYFGSFDAFGESWGPEMDGRLVRQFGGPEGPEPFVAAPNNIRNFFETGQTFTNSVALNASSEDSDFRLSYTNLNQRGTVPNTDLNRNTFYTSVGRRIGEKLSVRANAMYIDGSSDNVPNAGYDESSSIMYGWLWYPRNLPIDRLRNYWRTENEQQRNHESLWTNNPFFLVNENTNSYQRRRLFGNVKVQYDLTNNFNIRYRFSADVNNESRQYRRAISTRGTPGERGSYREDELFFREMNNELMLNYDMKNRTGAFNLQASVGANAMQQVSSETRNYAPGLNIPGLYSLGNALGNISTSAFDQEKRINSIFGLATLSYRNAIYLDVTARNDWSSTLPKDNNSYFYPSASLSAVFTELLGLYEGTLSFGKVRLAYAQVGGDTDPYNLVDVFTFGDLYDGQPVTSRSAFLRNPNLRPETTTSYEVGTDLRFFNGRLQLDAAYYFISSKDQIINLPLAISSGNRSRLINAGEIQNQGIEILLSGQPIRNPNGLTWDVSLNFTRNRSQVISIAPGIESYQIVADMYPADGGQDLALEARVGEPMGQLTGLDWERVEGGEFDGQIIHDENGYPILRNERVSAGTFQPDFIAGLINTFSYKNFTFGFQFDGRVGGVIFSRTHTMLASGGAITNEGDDRLGSILEGRVQYAPLDYDSDGQPIRNPDGSYPWGEPTSEGSFVGPGVKLAPDGSYVSNDIGVPTRDYVYRYYNNIFNRDVITTGAYDNTWMKLREVRLTYRLPANLLSRVKLQRASVSVVGRNLLLFTNVPTIDPETFSIRNGQIVQGFESTQLPSVRSFGINLNIGL